MMRKIEDLHTYQERARNFIHDVKRCALFMGLGLGKTASTLTAMVDLLDGFGVSRVLVIAPLRVANSVWHKETEGWKHLHHLRVSVCTGSESKRRSALMTTADVYVINRENVQWLVDLYGKKWPFDAVIVDESSSFKNPASKRFKRLRRVMPFVEYLVLLTATPSPNGLLDLWSQIYLIDGGKALGRTMTEYKNRFFESDYMGYSYTPKEGAAEQIHELIAPYVLSLSASDYLEVPERIDLVETVDIGPKARSAYEEFERELLIELEDGEELIAETAAALANKLLQWSNGAVYTDEHRNWSEVHRAKLDALGELVEQNQGESMLVAYNFKSDLARLRARFPQAVVLDKDPETIDRWNRGGIEMLLAHPQSAGHGLNLQYGGALIVWFGLTWSLEYYQQFVGRLDRQGQVRPTRNVRIVAEGTIDERVLDVIGMKDATQADLLSALKR